MHPAATPVLLGRLAVLRTELVDLAYALDVRGAYAAADVAMTTSAQIAKLCEEFSTQTIRLHRVIRTTPENPRNETRL